HRAPGGDDSCGMLREKRRPGLARRRRTHVERPSTPGKIEEPLVTRLRAWPLFPTSTGLPPDMISAPDGRTPHGHGRRCYAEKPLMARGSVGIATDTLSVAATCDEAALGSRNAPARRPLCVEVPKGPVLAALAPSPAEIKLGR